ncbi:MAG TPA: hypothetical protein VFD84_08375 [Candidatus Binatia bacterium]|nr:hypothetical protein [Candidatus Binatia bacterium]
MTKLLPTLLLAAALALLAAPAARAGNAVDDLKCYKIEDSPRKQSYTADLVNGLVLDTGCVVKVPAKLLCNAVGIANSTPAPPFTGIGQNLLGTVYMCCKLECPKVSEPVNINDVTFGSRQGTIASTKLLCAPASTLNAV